MAQQKSHFIINIEELCENCQFAITYNEYVKQHHISAGIPVDCRESTFCTKLNTVCEYNTYSLPFSLSDRDIAAAFLLEKNDNVSIGRLRRGEVNIQKYASVLENLYARTPYIIRILEYRDLLHSDMLTLRMNKSTDILHNAFYPFTNSSFFSGWNNSAFSKENIETLIHGFDDLKTSDPNYHIKSLAKKILTKCFLKLDPHITYPSTITNMLCTLLRLINEVPSKDVKQTIDKSINAILDGLRNNDAEPQYNYVFDPLKFPSLKMMLLRFYGVTDYSKLRKFLEYSIDIYPQKVDKKVVYKAQETAILKGILSLILQEKFNISDEKICNFIWENLEPKLDDNCNVTFDGFLEWLSNLIRKEILSSTV